MDFSSAHPRLQPALATRGYSVATAVQEAVLDAGLAGLDLLVSAETGSGKTVAFGLAMAGEVLDAPRSEPGVEVRAAPKGPRALVIAPTRELALQVRRELAWLYAPLRVVSAVGGMSVRNEQRALHQGADIVVGTPGRLCDHLGSGALDPTGLRVVVLDEADEMLDMGFREELEQILGAAPSGRRLFFSATFPPGIERLVASFAQEPRRICVTPPGEAHRDIEYRAVTVIPIEREAALVNVLRLFDARAALVFGATREGVEHLRARLVERGFAAGVISGDLSQAERNRALEALRRGETRVLVATDVAARGLDLPDLDLVIQADLPLDGSVFQHRCGRTGRAGRKGTAVTLVPTVRRRQAERVFHEAGVEPLWSAPPTPELIESRDKQRIAAEIEAMCAEVGDEDRAAADEVLAAGDPRTLVAVLLRQLRQRRPEPEETPRTLDFLARGRADRRRDGARPHFEPRPHFEGRARPARPEAPHAEAARPDAAPPRAPAGEDAPTDVRPIRPEPRGEPRGEPRSEPRTEPRVAPERREEAPRPAEAPRAPARYEARRGGDRPLRRPDEHGPRRFEGDGRFEGSPRFDGPPRFEGEVRRPGPPRGGDGVWFRVNVGRNQEADPRWLLPMLCRRGRVERQHIGAIRIFDAETRFAVDPAVAEAFFHHARRLDRREPWVHIDVVEGG